MAAIPDQAKSALRNVQTKEGGKTMIDVVVLTVSNCDQNQSHPLDDHPTLALRGEFFFAKQRRANWGGQKSLEGG